MRYTGLQEGSTSDSVKHFISKAVSTVVFEQILHPYIMIIMAINNFEHLCYRQYYKHFINIISFNLHKIPIK